MLKKIKGKGIRGFLGARSCNFLSKNCYFVCVVWGVCREGCVCMCVISTMVCMWRSKDNFWYLGLS